MKFVRCVARLAASFVFCFAAVGAAEAAVSHDSSFDWQTLTTAHFSVHYHDGEEARAREVAAIAEQVHAKLAPLFKWTPADRTEIVLTDEYDISNGYTTFFPSNHVELLLAPPDDLDTLEDHAGWLETVITHEYTHVLHLDKVRGAPGVLRNIFGRFPYLFPNALEPTWLIEGIAVYYETDLARGIGRGQSTLYDMLMRMEIADGMKPLRQVNQQVDTWPNGTVPYLYGAQFYEFAARRYGEDSIQRWVENYSDNLIPFRILSNSRAAFGRDLEQAWNEFEQDRREYYTAQLSGIRNRGEQTGERLTSDGYFAAQTRGLPDGTVFWTVFDGRNDPALMVWRPGASQAQRVAKVHFGARIDVHPDAGVLVAQPEVCRNARYYYDLYRIDPKTGREDRLTHCARYRVAAWSGNGKRIAAVHHELGHSSLDILDENGVAMERLWSGAGDETLGDLDWSPDGKAIVAAVWRRESGWNIELFSLADKRWQALTNDSAIDTQPRFSHDGTSVLFSSDHGGVYNLRRVALTGGRIETLTNVVGGAFHPTEAGLDNALYYIGYGPKGYDLFRLAAPVASATPVVAPGTSGVAQAVPALAAEPASEPYSPWSSLAPRWWIPHLVAETGRTEIGAITSGSDTLGRHLYALDIAYDIDNGTAVGQLDYVYDRWFPVLKLSAGRENLFERNGDNEITRLRHSDTMQAEAVFPWLSYDHRWSFHAAALKIHESDALVQNGATPGLDHRDALLGMALVFDSSKYFPLSVSRSHGREVRVVAEDSDAFTSDYRGKVYTLDWREFFPLGDEHVLALRYLAGRGDEGARPFELGGSRGAAPAPVVLGSTWFDTPFNVRVYGLRGYPAGLSGLIGRNVELGSVEWRFPVERIERGIMTPPLAIHHLSGTVFVDAGAAWNDGGDPGTTRTGAGLEANADVSLLYSIRFGLRLGVAHGFDDGGENQVYLRLGAAF
jgi:hypothetical protein